MRIQSCLSAWLMMGGFAFLETPVACGQDAPPAGAPARAIPRDRVEKASTISPSRPPVRPSRQAPDYKAIGGNSALAGLRNPFDGSSRESGRGSLGLGSPQYQGAGGASGGIGSGPMALPELPGAVASTPSVTSPGPGQTPAPGAAAPGAEAFGGAGAGAGAFDATAAMEGPGFGGGLGAASEALPMIGDMSPLRTSVFRGSSVFPSASPGVGPPNPPGSRGASLPYPSVRGFKVSENMSPRPQDRFFYNFNYYNNVNTAINAYNQVPIDHMKAYRHLFGWEQTFNEGKGSIGLRLPLNTLTADPTVQGLSTPTKTALGNLTVFAKYILEQNPRTGSLVSVGLAVTAPTGPGRFAGAPYLFGLNTTTIQPFLGYIYNFGDFYLQGFSAFDFPANYRDVTLMYNDVGLGYYVFRSDDPEDLVTAFAPTFEVHVNTPFTHNDWRNRADIAATPNVVNLTYGLNFQFRRTAVLTAALITPVTYPKPFDVEAALLLNVYYGRTRASALRLTPPPSL